MQSQGQILPEPMLLAGDTPRARSTDHTTSHRAADRSQKTLPRVRMAVLDILRLRGPLTGNELNDAFHNGTKNYGKAHWDSPRKRAGEMAEDGLLTADRSNGSEAVYDLSEAGLAFVAMIRDWNEMSR